MDEQRDTDPMSPRYPSADRRTQPEEWGGGSDHFAAQLGASRSGRLRFTNGAHRVVIRAGSHLRGLYRARFGERMPVVKVRGGVVSIRYTRVASCDWTGNHPERPAEVALNAGIPWDVEVRGGASRLLADLSGLRLGSLSVDGGASRLEVVLPDPSGAVSVVILGGASNVAIRRPEGVAARLRVEGGVTNLTLPHRGGAVVPEPLTPRLSESTRLSPRPSITDHKEETHVRQTIRHPDRHHQEKHRDLVS